MQENENDVEVLVRPNGPYRVSGRFRLVDIDGNEFPLPEGWDADRPIALCRCGHSAIKPFCDSSHKRIGFTPETRAVPPSA
ncbi:MAG TPA: CDGSH iron-sulfur domain-containing protein [Dehalococcoidia bacterium]|nr:CDGSH iron-sulfur domain-containing protein [Dehalococcoidia bacterium]